MNKLTKWDRFNAPFSWDPFRELEEMQNRLTSFLVSAYHFSEVLVKPKR